MPTKMPRTAITARERDKKIRWLRKVRERIQYLSVALRPQRVRMMWLENLAKEET